MVSSTGGCGCFLGAAGGCGCWGCGRGGLGLPRSRCRSAPSGAGLRFRRVLRKAGPNNNSPDRSSSPGPGAPRMRRFCISVRARRTRESAFFFACGFDLRFAQRFWDLRDTWSLLRGLQITNTAPVLRAVNSLICACVKRLSRPKSSLGALWSFGPTRRDGSPDGRIDHQTPRVLRSKHGLRPSKAPPALRQHAAGS